MTEERGGSRAVRFRPQVRRNSASLSAIEVAYNGENTSLFRLTGAEFVVSSEGSPTLSSPRHAAGSMMLFSEDTSNYKLSIDEADGAETKEKKEIVRYQSNASFLNSKQRACFIKAFENINNAKCRIFGVYLVSEEVQKPATKKKPSRTKKRSQISFRVTNSDEDDSNGLSDDDLQIFNERSLKLFASYVPCRLLNGLIDQLLSKPLPRGSEDMQVSLNYQLREKITGALLIADISHFSKQAREYVRKNVRNVHGQNTRSLAAEELFKFLWQELFYSLVDLITKAGGDIVKFIGDSVFAVFPVDQVSFKTAMQATRTAFKVAIKAMDSLDRRVHCGLGYGSMYYNIIGTRRVEGFLTGKALDQATNCEKEASSFSDEGKFWPIAVSTEALKNLSLSGKVCEAYFQSREKISVAVKSIHKADCFIPYSMNYLADSLDEILPTEEAPPIMKVVEEKLQTMLRNPRECDILRLILSHTFPSIVSNYISLVGAPLWATELRVCTCMFILIDGDWSNLTDEKMLILHDAVCTIQESVENLAGEFLRFVVDDKGAQCFIAFGLPPRKFSQNSVRAAVCAVDIHERIESLRKKKLEARLKRNQTEHNTRKAAAEHSRGPSYRLMNSFRKKKSIRNTEVLAHDNGLEALNVCIGITSGKVVCGNVGGESRCEYTLHGECVNFANNLMNHAKLLSRPKSRRQSSPNTAALGKSKMMEETISKKASNEGGVRYATVDNQRVSTSSRKKFVHPMILAGRHMRIVVGSEIHKATVTHVSYSKKEKVQVGDHIRENERSGERENVYRVTGLILPNHAEIVNKYTDNKLVGRMHIVSDIYQQLDAFITGKNTRSSTMVGVIKGKSGMGKTSVACKIYNKLLDDDASRLRNKKNKEDTLTRVVPIFIQSTCIERHSLYFVLRAVLLQLLTNIYPNHYKWPQTLHEAHEFVRSSLQVNKRYTFHQYTEMVTRIFQPYDSNPKSFSDVADKFKQLVKAIVDQHKLIFVFDDWHLMNGTIREVFSLLVSELNADVSSLRAGLIVTCDHLFIETNPILENPSAEVVLEPLRPRDFRLLDNEWKLLPTILIDYIVDMVDGNPRHAEELLKILKKTEWFSRRKGDKTVLTLEAFSCIQDRKLEYRDFVVREKQNSVGSEMLMSMHPSSFMLNSVVEGSSRRGPKPNKRVQNKSVRNTSARAGVTLRRTRKVKSRSSKKQSVANTLLDPPDALRKLKIKFTDYFDENIYNTEELLTAYIDGTNVMQHMCVKIAAVLGYTFKVRHLCFILSQLTDDVLCLNNELQGNNKGLMVATWGDEDFIQESIVATLAGLQDIGIFKVIKGVSDDVEYEFTTPLLREVTLNLLPQYLKLVIHRIISSAIKCDRFITDDFSSPVEFHRFVSLHADKAHDTDSLQQSWESLKEIETHCYQTGQVQYFYDTLSRMMTWHSFFVLEQNSPLSRMSSIDTTGLTRNLNTDNSGSHLRRSRINALNPTKTELNDDMLERFREWYKELGALEIGKTLRIGAEFTLWYSKFIGETLTGEIRRNALHIVKYGIRWLEDHYYRLNQTNNTLEQVSVALELALCYSSKVSIENDKIDFKPLMRYLNTVHTDIESLTPLQEAEFYKCYTSCLGTNTMMASTLAKKIEKFGSNLNDMARNIQELCLMRHLVATSRLNLSYWALSIAVQKNKKTKDKKPVDISIYILSADKSIPTEVRNWLEEPDNVSRTPSLLWKESKFRYLIQLILCSAFYPETVPKPDLVKLVEAVIRQQYGDNWQTQKDYIKCEDKRFADLCTFLENN